jgi:hypothetical protein
VVFLFTNSYYATYNLTAFYQQVSPPHLVDEFVEMNTSTLLGRALKREMAAVTEPKLGKDSPSCFDPFLGKPTVMKLPVPLYNFRQYAYVAG